MRTDARSTHRRASVFLSIVVSAVLVSYYTRPAVAFAVIVLASLILDDCQ
jgi:hypothetical protein